VRRWLRNANARDLRDSSTAAYELEASLALWKEHQESSWYVRIMESMLDWKGIRSEELFARQTIEGAIQNVIGNNVVVEFREQNPTQKEGLPVSCHLRGAAPFRRNLKTPRRSDGRAGCSSLLGVCRRKWHTALTSVRR
jgi:hypothetical protein